MFSSLYNHIIPYSTFKIKRSYYLYVNKDQCENVQQKHHQLQLLALDIYDKYLRLSRNDKIFIEKITGFHIRNVDDDYHNPYNTKEIFISSIKPLSIIFNHNSLTIKSYIDQKKKNNSQYDHIPCTTDYAYSRFLEGEALTSYESMAETIEYYFLPTIDNFKKLNTILDTVIGQWQYLESCVNLLKHLQGEMQYDYMERQGHLLWQYVMSVESEEADNAYKFFMTHLYLHSKECGCNLYKNKYDDINYHYLNFWNYQILPKEFEILLPHGQPMFRWNNIIDKRKNMLEDIEHEGDKIFLYNRFQETVPNIKNNTQKKNKI